MNLYSLLRSRLRRRLTALQSVRPQGVELVYQVRRTVWLVLLVVLAAALSLLIRTGLPAAYRRQAVTELSMWNHHRHMAGLTQQLVDEFNATIGREHRIRVSLRTLGDDAFEVFPDAQARGEGPDLYTDTPRYPDPFEAGAVAYLDSIPGFEEWKRQWPDWYWVEGITTNRGHVYAIPAKVFNSRLIYNRDLFRAVGLDPDRPPRSYEEVKHAAKMITDRARQDFRFCVPGRRAMAARVDAQPVGGSQRNSGLLGLHERTLGDERVCRRV